MLTVDPSSFQRSAGLTGGGTVSWQCAPAAVPYGVDAEELPDGLVVRGSRAPLHGRVVTGGDHRIAMAFAVLGAASGGEIVVDDPGCVAVSYPRFWDDLENVVG